MRQSIQTLEESKHFRVERLDDGVYAAIAREGGAACSNAGIVDLGDRTLVFDTFETPIAAEDLRRAAEHLTGRPASYVVNSHAHPDHWLGNQVFADHAAIIATPAIREQMMAVADEMLESADELEEMLEEDRRRLEAETDERLRAQIEHAIQRWQYNLECLPILELRLPNLAFEERLTFHGSERAAALISRGVGHTSGDCWLNLPEEHIAFLGDLAFFGGRPFMVHCDPDAWVAQLEELERSDIATFVPGHGPLGTKQDLALEREYITTLQALVTRAVEGGEPVEMVLQRPLPAPFDAWSIDGLPAEHNVRALYERLAAP